MAMFTLHKQWVGIISFCHILSHNQENVTFNSSSAHILIYIQLFACFWTQLITVAPQRAVGLCIYWHCVQW